VKKLNNIIPKNMSNELLIKTYELIKKTIEMRSSSAAENSMTLLNKKMDLSELKEYDLTITPNGQFYRKDKQGFLAALMKKMYDDRVQYKQKMLESKQKYEQTPNDQLSIEISRYHNLQLAKKIQLNSAYGACANKYFRWFDLKNAEAITMAGQLSIRWIEKKLNSYLNDLLKTQNEDYVIAIDTDSVYVSFDSLVRKVYGQPEVWNKERIVDFLDKIAEQKIEPYIDQAYKELADYVNAYAQKMKMKRENIADKAIWTAKKRYIMNVWDSEGVRYKEPSLKMMGIEAIRSSTPSVCREYITNTLNLIMNSGEEEMQEYIANIKKEFKSLSFNEVAFPRGVSLTSTKINQYGKSYIEPYENKDGTYKKGTPIQVKGSILYNNMLKKLNLTNKYEIISDGEKIKFTYLKIPNPIQDTVIAAPNGLPEEFGLEKYIDYDLQFEKSYLTPTNKILEVIGWNHEKVQTLEDWFS